MPLNKALLALTVLCLMMAAPAAAQQVDSLAAAREQFSPAQQRILDRLRQSGLSREQMRQRLRQSGYDPNLADRYYDELNAPRDSAGNRMASSITRPLPQPSGNLVSALSRIGVLQPTDSIAEAMRPHPDTLRARVQPRRPETEEPQVFGRELFAATTQFDPIMAGPSIRNTGWGRVIS